MRFSRFKFIAVFCLLAIFSSLVYAQKDKSRLKESAPVEVKANLLVFDAAAQKPIDNVKLEDIKVFEDGVEQKITRFVKKERQANIGLLIDNSGSLRTQFPLILNVAATIVNNIRPTDEMFALRFISSDKITLKQEWTADKNLLLKALSEMSVEGGSSAVTDAVYLAAREIAKREKDESSKRHALILISDCEDRASFYKLDEALAPLKKTDVQFFVLAPVSELENEKSPFVPKTARGRAEDFANRLAFETNGRAFILKESNSKKRETEILSALKEILSELRSQYVIGYTSINQSRNGKARKLTVQIADGAGGEKRQSFIRESFVVPEDKK